MGFGNKKTVIVLLLESGTSTPIEVVNGIVSMVDLTTMFGLVFQRTVAEGALGIYHSTVLVQLMSRNGAWKGGRFAKQVRSLLRSIGLVLERLVQTADLCSLRELDPLVGKKGLCK